MTRLLIVVLIFGMLAMLLLPSEAAAQRRRKRGHACTTDLASCPVQGCGGAGTDFLLNRSKNRVTSPATANVVDKSLNDLRQMQQPASWQPNQNRSSIQGANLEGQGVRVMGFLKFAKREHGESCNCGLDAQGAPGELLTDIHMVLTDQVSDPEATSVTAEITPRVRARRSHPITWTHARIFQLKGKFIRVTGFLMLDTQHIGSPLVRATNWEVHPITKVEFCTQTVADCQAGMGWKNVP